MKCIYDNQSEATHICSVCGSPLCKICGYTVEGESYCNDCYVELTERKERKVR